MKPAMPPLAPVKVLAKLLQPRPVAAAGSAEADDDDAENDRHFQHCEHELEFAGLLHSEIVQN